MPQNNTFSKKNWIILLLFGMLGQIAWSVENMYFNLFVYDTVAKDLDAITLMVQLSGIVATVVTLLFGTLSDKTGNRRLFISLGYTIWGVTVALFGFLKPELVGRIFSLPETRTVSVTLVLVIAGDCIMTLFGSLSNDAAFNAWVTDNTRPSFRGKVEGVLAILPLIAMLIVAGGFGILKEVIGYSALFLSLGIVITLCGIFGLFYIKDSESLKPSGSLRDVFYGFKPSVLKANLPLYLTFTIILVYGIACQIFMPYLIIYMTTYLGFSPIEYSIVFGGAIAVGAVINLYLGRLSDRYEKPKLLYIASGVMAAGLFFMYISRTSAHIFTLVLFGLSGFVMITGYIFVSALSGSVVRDYTPQSDAGKLQGVRMVFSVLLPMIFGPMIGNAINKAMSVPYENAGADAMTTEYIPAPEIFLAGSLVTLLLFALIPPLVKMTSKNKSRTANE